MLVLLAACGLGLLALPALGRRVGRRMAPDEWARLCAAALAAGALAVEAAVALAALPTVLRAVGARAVAAACERMLGALAPGGAAVGLGAAALAVALPVLAAVGVVRARRAATAARVDAWLGDHGRRGPYELVVLPTGRPLAVSVPGAPGQIVISEGLRTVLGPAELEAVLDHETAHLAHGHDRYLLLATALGHAFGPFPPVRRSVAVLRLALERWADEAAADAPTADARRHVRDALLGVAIAEVAPQRVAAFGAAETIAERLDALDAPPLRSRFARPALLYGPASLLVGSALAAAGWWASDAQAMLAMAGRCA